MKETLHIYIRVSTQIQEEDGTSLETQKELGIERSQKLGWDYKIWDEGSQSSSKDDLSNRPVLYELLNEVDKGTVNHLYVWNTDRLSRNMSTWGFIRTKLINNDVKLHTPTGEMMLSDPTTNLLLGVLSEFSNYDNQIRTERFRIGKLSKIRDGFWKGGPPPYGYQLEDGKLVVDETESQWVVTIHQMYRDGNSVDEIRNELMKNGVMTRRGNPVWSHGSINSMLRNTHYDGYWMYEDKKSGDLIRVVCPRICDPQLIGDVKDSIKKRSYGSKDPSSQRVLKQNKHTYLLNKIMYCGVCGSLYYGNFKKTQTSYYHCSNKTNKYRDKHTHRHKECSSKRNLRIDTTETVIWNEVVSVISDSNLFKETIKTEVMGSQTTHSLNEKEKKLITKNISKLESEIEKITDSIVNLTTQNLLTESRDLKSVISKLEDKRRESESEIVHLTKQLQQKESENRWVDWLKEYKGKINQLNDLTTEERREFLSGVVEKIVVNPNEDRQTHHIEIYFQFPYVGDKLVWNDESNKSKGYTLKEGKKVRRKTTNLLKKLTK